MYYRFLRRALHFALYDFFCYNTAMLKIRLKRVGRRHDPSYRVVVVESSRAAKSGRSWEVLGSYDPRKKQEEAALLKAERVRYWLSCGAKPSITVHNILARAGVVTGASGNALSHRRPAVSTAAVELEALVPSKGNSLTV